MKSIYNWEDLRPYGVDMLTGESCGYDYRLLCDVTRAGVILIEHCLDAPISPRPSWNHGDGAVGSIMLAPQMVIPLAVIALFDAGCRRVFITYSGAVHGVEATDSTEREENFVRWHQAEFCESCKRYGAGDGIQFQYRNRGYGRNLHAMSGRAS